MYLGEAEHLAQNLGEIMAHNLGEGDGARLRPLRAAPFFKLPPFLKMTNTDPFAAWFVVTGVATLGGIRVVRSVIGANSSLPIVAYAPGRGRRPRRAARLRPLP